MHNHTLGNRILFCSSLGIFNWIPRGGKKEQDLTEILWNKEGYY